MEHTINLNSAGVELFGDYGGAVALSEIVDTFPKSLVAEDFLVEGTDVLYRSTTANGLAADMTEYDDITGEKVYWYLIGQTA